MTKQELKSILGERSSMKLQDKCHGCTKNTVVIAGFDKGEAYSIGGAAYKVNSKEVNVKDVFLKCSSCYHADPILKNWMPTEVYSRVCGYLRPLKQWNKGKQAEHIVKKEFDMNKALQSSKKMV